MYQGLGCAMIRWSGFMAGPTEIWYMKPDWFREGIFGEKPDPNNLEATHINLGSIISENREDIWENLQAEIWSPFGEASDLILGLGLGHTSMSIGDVIRMKDGSVWICCSVGFEKIKESVEAEKNGEYKDDSFHNPGSPDDYISRF